MPEIIWTSYLRYRATGRGFDLDLIENILRFSSERWLTDKSISNGENTSPLVRLSGDLSVSQPANDIMM